MSDVTIAVAGAGVIGRSHITAIANSQSCRLGAIVEPGPAGTAVGEAYGVPCYEDINDLLAAGRVDAVIVATPNATHCPIGVKCIESGLPILVEKPIAESVEAARTLTAAAERNGVPLLVGHHRRHNPILRSAHDMVRAGAIGQPISATVMYTFRKPDGYFDVAWRRQPGGGPILINLIHEIDTMRFLYGEIDTLQAAVSNEARGFPVEDTAATLLRFESGALATVSLSDAVDSPWSWDMTTGESPQFARQNVPTHFLSGTEGSLTVPTLEHWRYDGVKSWHEPMTRTFMPLKPANPYSVQIEHFARVVRGEEAPLVTGADATETLRATLAVREAGGTGAPVRLAAA